MAQVVIGSDHGAFELKQAMVAHLQSLGKEVIDVGTHDGSRCDYPDIASLVCKEVLEKTIPGILLCGTGIGISIAANKHQNIRCALCHDHYTAKLCRQHNDANVLAIGGRTCGIEVAKEMVETFLSTPFEGDRHASRLAKIAAIEKSSAL
eukprot:GILJ01002612.1.p1 GENE.GILJ01002612.1~~GILJ01002612.1.p1  ORF type:complete len:150 (+),score=15.80 GILJ01002612.1:42-491(+)